MNYHSLIIMLYALINCTISPAANFMSSSMSNHNKRSVRIIIISMPDMQFRLDAIKKRIDNLGLKSIVSVVVPKTRTEILSMKNVERYAKWAVTPAEVFSILHGDQKAFQQTSAYWTRDITLGEVSLTLAHIEAAVESMKSDEGTVTLIVEDDAVFIEDFTRVFERILLEAPKDFDLIFLGDAPIGALERQKVSLFLCLRGYAYQVISAARSAHIAYHNQPMPICCLVAVRLTGIL